MVGFNNRSVDFNNPPVDFNNPPVGLNNPPVGLRITWRAERALATRLLDWFTLNFCVGAL